MNLALFDFDGTITTREMFPDFMRFAVTPARLAVGKVLLAPLIAGYRLGALPGNAVRASIVNFGFRGVAEAKIRQAGADFSREILPGALRPQALERIRWHQAQGDTVAVVSGGLDFYLADWCKQNELEFFCSELEVEQGALTGRYRGEQCVGKEKSRRVRERYDLPDYSTVYAYGDTEEDRDLLSLADKRFFRWQEIG